MEKVIEKFLRYVKYDTESDPESNTVPTTPGQKVLAHQLGKELSEMGLVNIDVDDNGYVMAELPSNMDKKVPAVGLIAHMDTSPDMSGKDVKPKFVENYDGGDIVLNKEHNIVLSPKDFPELLNYKGETLITTDGTTLLGADDKAGVAEIMTAVEYLAAHPEIPHGTIKIGFTPDEEVGAGADHFDVKKFNADFAYTVDGGTVGHYEYENFNAAGAKLVFHGRNVHPGSAKNKMINSMLIAVEFMNALPAKDVPENTEGYEGFFHLTDMKGEVEETVLRYIIRDFDMDSFKARKQLVESIAEKLNKKYGAGTVDCIVKDSYFNMKEKFENCGYIVDIMKKAIENTGIKAEAEPVRGGTDGARLSFMGLPTPNMFTGGENYHGKYEYVPMGSMVKAVEALVEIVKLVSQM
jgi:tripeptide aminopeptidase